MADITATFGLDTNEFRSGIRQVQQEAREAGRQVEQHLRAGKHAAEGLGGAMRHVGHEVSSSAQAFHHFIGIPGMIAAVGAEFYELGHVITENVISQLEGGAEKAHEFMAALTGKDAKTQLEEIGKEAKKVADELTKATEHGGGGSRHNWLQALAFGESPADMQDRLDTLRRRAGELHGIDRRDEGRAKAEKDAKAEDQALLTRDRTRASAMDGSDRIQAEVAVRIHELQMQLLGDRTDREKELIQETIGWEEQRRDMELATLADRERAEAIKTAEEKAKAEQAAARQHERAAAEFGFGTIESAIRTEELEGNRELAELDRARLALARDILAIKQSEALTDEEKARFIREAQEAEEAEEAGISRKFAEDGHGSRRGRSPEIKAGIGAGFETVVFGGGFSSEMKQNTQELKRVNQTLEFIRQYVRELQAGINRAVYS